MICSRHVRKISLFDSAAPAGGTVAHNAPDLAFGFTLTSQDARKRAPEVSSRRHHANFRVDLPRRNGSLTFVATALWLAPAGHPSVPWSTIPIAVFAALVAIHDRWPRLNSTPVSPAPVPLRASGY